MAFLSFNITVGVGGVTLSDLGNRTFTTGTYDIGQEFDIEEIRYSISLAEAIHNGDITSATDSVGRNITAQSTLNDTISLLNRAGHIFDTDELDEGTTNLYFTQARARESISIEAGSQSLLGYNDTTGELSVEQLLITDVTVDTTYGSLADFVDDDNDIYTSGGPTPKIFEEGDIVILTNAQPNEKTIIHNGGTTGTTADWTIISTNIDDIYIRSLFSGDNPISYNQSTGQFSLLYDNDTILINSSGEIFVDEGALTIDVSQITGLATEINNTVFDTTNFVDSATIDFTVTSGTSVTAIVINDSIDADKLAVTGNGTSGQVLTSNGDGTFSWANDQDTTYTAGDALDLNVTEFNVLFDNDTIKLNTAGELYVDESVLTSFDYENGITEDSGTVKLGGALIEDTEIQGFSDYSLTLDALSDFTLFVDNGIDPEGSFNLALSGQTTLFQASSTGNKRLVLSQTAATLENLTNSSDGGGAVILSDNDSRISYTTNSFGDTTTLIVEDGLIRFTSTNANIGGRLLLDEDNTAAGQDGLIRWNGDNFQGYKDGTWVNLDTQGSTPLAGDAIEVDSSFTINVLYDDDTIKINGNNQLFVDEAALTITASQVSDFTTEVNNTIFVADYFIDSTTIDFTVTTEPSVTAEVSVGSLTEDYLSIVTPSTGSDGDVLTSDGNGNFEWSDPSEFSKKSWTWGAASIANNNTNRFLDRHDGAVTNLTPYVAWYNCQLKAISLSQDGTTTWTAEIYVNGTSVATLSSGGNSTAFTVLSSPVSISAGDSISFYLNGTGVRRPAIDAYFEEE